MPIEPLRGAVEAWHLCWSSGRQRVAPSRPYPVLRFFSKPPCYCGLPGAFLPPAWAACAITLDAVTLTLDPPPLPCYLYPFEGSAPLAHTSGMWHTAVQTAMSRPVVLVASAAALGWRLFTVG